MRSGETTRAPPWAAAGETREKRDRRSHKRERDQKSAGAQKADSGRNSNAALAAHLIAQHRIQSGSLRKSTLPVGVRSRHSDQTFVA